MKNNMVQWVEELLNAPVKKAMPILSFPAIQLMGISVNELISSSDLQAKGMKIIADRVDSAASVSLMDLSIEAEAFGSTVHFSDDEVPTVIGNIVSTEEEEEAEALKIPEVGTGRTSIYIEAIEKAVKLITDRPVFAGIIGPFSLAGRILDVTEAMIYCYEEPDMVHIVLEKATAFIIEYCKAYKKVGANGVVIAEPLAGLLSPHLAKEFSAEYIKKIVTAVQDDSFIIIYHNCGNSVIAMMDSIVTNGCPIVHFGNAVNMEEIMPLIPKNIIAMGNIDPAGEIKNGTPASIRNVTLDVMNACCKYPNYVISTGCDIPPSSKWKNIDAFFQAVQEFHQK